MGRRIFDRGAYEAAVRKAQREAWDRLTPEQREVRFRLAEERAPWEPGQQLAVYLAIRDGGRGPDDAPRITDAVSVATTLWLPAERMADIAAGGDRLDAACGFVATHLAGELPGLVGDRAMLLGQRHDLHTWLPLLAAAWKEDTDGE